MKNFQSPHIHVESLDSASTVDSFVERELELETGVLCCTDHGYLGACIQVYQKAKKAGLTPILGIEAYHRDDNCSILTKAGVPKDKDGTFKDFYKYGHVTLHAKDQTAYEGLIKRISDADLTAEQHGSERKPIFNWGILEELGSLNITGTSGCLIGTVGRMLMKDRLDLAEQYYERIRGCFKPGNFYVEIMPHRCDKNWVNGCFLYLEDGQTLKFYPGKKVRTSVYNEIAVSDLAKVKSGKFGKLLAVKNYSTWNEVPSLEIVKCEFVQDFMPNECRPWADDGDLQRGLNQYLIGMARKHGDRVIISDDAHYAHPNEKVVQEVKLGGMGDNFKFYGAYHRQSSAEAFEYFHTFMGMDEKEFEGYVDNNREWASNFKDFKLEYKPSLPGSFYPKDTLKYLMDLIQKHGRMDWTNSAMKDRLKQEVDLLHNNGTVDLLPYFFLAEEGPDLYKQNNELGGVARGSAGGVLISYLLRIIHLNPLNPEYDLSLDRFLTLDRIKTGKYPDIDQDLPHRKLLEGPDGLFERRFKGHYAQIGTKNKLRLKLALKDLSRAIWGRVTEEVESLCKTIPNPPQGIEDESFLFGYESDDGQQVDGLFATHEGLQKFAKKYPEHWESVVKLTGLGRSHGRHAAAFVIADKPIDTFIPLMTVNGVRTTQYTKDDCEFVGAIKMDYLTLNTLTDITNAVRMIQERDGGNIPESAQLNGITVPKLQLLPHNDELLDIWNLPYDPDVFEDICQGKTETVFQLNTGGAVKWLREFNFEKPDGSGKLINSIADIAAFTALDRPGPLDAIISQGEAKRNMLQEYAARARGEAPFDEIEALKDLLPDTYGVLVYQEALQRVFQDLSGCSGVEANTFREKISKKKMEDVLKYYPMFIENASKKIGKEQADKIWRQIYTFGQYGFNKSHSVAYGITAYTCAYLKHHFPLEWWCAVLQNADKNEIVEKFWLYCNQFVSLPDIKYPVSNFEIINDKIITPLGQLQGVGEGSHAELVAGAPYTDIKDFCTRIMNTKESKATFNEEGKKRAGRSALNDGVVNRLIVSGVLDSLFPANLSIPAKLEMYQKTMAEVTGKKQKKIPEEYTTLNPLKIYQHRKKILPIYSRNLRTILSRIGNFGITQSSEVFADKKITEYHYNPENPEIVDYILKVLNYKKFPYGLYKLLGGNELLGANESETLIGSDRKSFKCAAVGYVLKAERFKFQKGTREAYKLLMEVEGQIFEFVQWPNWKTGQLIAPEKNLTGSISVVLLERYSNQKPFSIQCIVEIEPAIEEKPKK